MLGSQMESIASEAGAWSQHPRVRRGSSMKGMSIALAILLVVTAAVIFWALTDDVPVIDEPQSVQSYSQPPYRN